MKILFVSLLSILFVSCSDSTKPNVELARNMMESPAIKAQDYNPKAADGLAMRLPPENTAPVGFTPYAFKGKPDLAANQKNPLASQLSDAEVMKRAQHLYETYCAVCHGATGAGNGPVAEKMLQKPPSLLTAKIRQWSDGSIYHVVTDGQGLMGNYATQILEQDRWKVVLYVRKLQAENKEEVK